VIPYKLFLMLLVQLDKLDGTIELRDARAAALGIQLAMNGKDNKLKSAIRMLTKRSYPEIYDG
jgi:hypothetical protein